MRKNIIIPAVLLQMIIFFGCDKFLEEHPKSIASPNTVLNSAAGFDAVIVGIYSNITGWTKMYAWDNLPLKESLVDFQYAPFQPSVSNAGVLSSDYSVNFTWTNQYKIISSANLIIANIGTIEGDVNVNRIEGEAKFLRAWAYFDLVQIFGDVPLVLEPVSDPSNFQPSRTPQGEVYNQIISDLKDAESKMNDAAPQPSRVNKWVAKAYLAKVYLTMAGNPNNITTFDGTSTFSQALDKAKEVINSGRYNINVPYQTVHLTTGDAETIWELLVPDLALYNHYTFLSQGIFTPSTSFINTFDANDVRGPAWGIKTSYVYNGNTYTFPLPTYMKFVDTIQYAKGQQFHSTLSITAMRLADMLLTAAEADNEVSASPSSDAYAWINAVRRRSGVADLPPGLSKSAFRDAVFLERRKELYGEGFSWFDLKRFNRFDLLNSTGRSFVTPIDDHLNYYPIYNAEIINNPNVTQNPGWPG